MTGKYDEGLKYLKKALVLDPSSRIIHQELANLSQIAQKEKESMKSLYRRMLGLKPDIPNKTNDKSALINVSLNFIKVLHIYLLQVNFMSLKVMTW